MTDEEIIELYWQRDETALAATDARYGAYCRTVAGNILSNAEDAEECVSDVWLRVWNAIPPGRPARLRPFLAKITRNLAFDRFRAGSAEKRGGGELPLVLSELGECVAVGDGAESAVLTSELSAAVSRFVRALPERDAGLFARRYFFAEPVRDIAARYGMTPNGVSVALNRVRKKLRAYLEQEGFLP